MIQHNYYSGRDHVDSFDCWCEPRVTFDAGVLHVLHQRLGGPTHAETIQTRTTKPDWITRVLTSIRQER